MPVRVVDVDGKPIADVVVSPWAIRSGQGHGLWGGDEDASEMNPQDVVTDASGCAEVIYPFYRDVVEQADQDLSKRLVVPMIKMGKCVVSVIDQDERPVAGARVRSWPNVGWWNDGSQIYAGSLLRSRDLLLDGEFKSTHDGEFPEPFSGSTDHDGKTTIYIPAGKESLVAGNEQYEIPAFLGRRHVEVSMRSGETSEVTIGVQPAGSDRLGEWDKLAGVVFGCSTREGRRICALPEVRAKVARLTRQFREAKNQNDPRLLSEAFTTIAEAFENAKDPVEASKWRDKAAQQQNRLDAP